MDNNPESISTLKLKLECNPPLDSSGEYTVNAIYYEDDPAYYDYKLFHMKFSPFNMGQGVTYVDNRPEEKNNCWIEDSIQYLEYLQHFVNCIKTNQYGVNDGSDPYIKYEPKSESTFGWSHRTNVLNLQLNVSHNVRSVYADEWQNLLYYMKASIGKHHLNEYIRTSTPLQL